MKNLSENSSRTKKGITRRDFMAGTAAATAFTVVPRHVLGGTGNVSPSEKVNVAIIGTGGQGIVNMKQLFTEPDVRIAALCDVNEESDYSMFYYGDTAGLKPAAELVRKQYGQTCPTYRDYNQMLDSEDIDAVLLATPDHSHGVIALAAIAKKKHLYCENPLCRTVYEARLVPVWDPFALPGTKEDSCRRDRRSWKRAGASASTAFCSSEPKVPCWAAAGRGLRVLFPKRKCVPTESRRKACRELRDTIATGSTAVGAKANRARTSTTPGLSLNLS
ncbi:MAG: Gfo/Idh/MocA family oxidoreductase [Sedimentisphaerales bacterium]|nr:Gfo/Idh/MocA family oxidoreductase [Sedimentisphaerales bacterium]